MSVQKLRSLQKKVIPAPYQVRGRLQPDPVRHDGLTGFNGKTLNRRLTLLIGLMSDVYGLMSESVFLDISLDHALDMTSVDFNSYLVRDFDGDLIVSDPCDPAIDAAAG